MRLPYDIHIEGVENPTGLRAVTFGNYETVLGVAGVQLMVNRFLKCFLTPKGSDISDIEYGTSLAGAMGGNIDSRSAEQLAIEAIDEAETTLRRYDIDEDVAPDERLAKAELLYVELSGKNSYIDVYVRLYSESGVVVDMLMRDRMR